MNIAVLGATKGMGREVARRLATRGDTLVVLARELDAATTTATDLQIRGARGAHPVVCDLASPATFAPALDAAEAAVGGKLDAVIVTAGAFGTQDQLEADLTLAHQVLDLDLTKTVIFCEHARTRLLAKGGGTLVVFSSVAGDRGRKTVGIYGAAKAGLSHYLEALDHKYRAAGLVTVCVKPGFVRTGMTEGLKAPPFAGEPEAVAADVVRALDRGTPMIYTPFMWRWVMTVIRYLPRFVMRRVGF